MWKERQENKREEKNRDSTDAGQKLSEETRQKLEGWGKAIAEGKSDRSERKRSEQRIKKREEREREREKEGREKKGREKKRRKKRRRKTRRTRTKRHTAQEGNRSRKGETKKSIHPSAKDAANFTKTFWGGQRKRKKGKNGKGSPGNRTIAQKESVARGDTIDADCETWQERERTD